MESFRFPEDPSRILEELNLYFVRFEDYYYSCSHLISLDKDESGSKRDTFLASLGNPALEALRETLENPEQENYQLILAAFRAKYATPSSTFKALKEFRNMVQNADEDLEHFVARVSRQSLLIRAACDADRNLSALDQVHIGMRNWELRDLSVANEWDLETLLEQRQTVSDNTEKDPTLDLQNIGLPNTLIIKRNNKPVITVHEDEEILPDSPSKKNDEPEDDEDTQDMGEEEEDLYEEDDEEDDENSRDNKMTLSGITITVKSTKSMDDNSEKSEKKRKLIEKMFKDIKNSSKEFKYRKLEPRAETEDELFKGLQSKSWYKSAKVPRKAKPMVCNHCSARFDEKKEYYAHKQKVCLTCHKCFNKKSELAFHLVEVHGDTSNQCATCGKIYSCKSGLDLHVQIVHEKNETYKCTYCAKGFPIERMLVNHIRRIHIRERKYSCERCGKGFETNGLLTKHINSVHEKKVAAICHICSKSFTSESCYRAHVLRVHENVRKFECEVCFARFHAGADLRKHKKGVHDKILDYVCEHCNKGFSRNSILQKHIKSIHTQERDYQCGLCPNAYVSRYNLLRHIQEAHEHVKQECNICHLEIAGFGAGNMAKHKRTAHGIHVIKATAQTIIA